MKLVVKFGNREMEEQYSFWSWHSALAFCFFALAIVSVFT